MSSPTPSAGPPLDHTGNLLGALSLSVADRTADAVGDAAGQSQTAAIALSALNDFLDAPSMDRLRSVLGLTPVGRRAAGRPPAGLRLRHAAPG